MSNKPARWDLTLTPGDDTFQRGPLVLGRGPSLTRWVAPAQIWFLMLRLLQDVDVGLGDDHVSQEAAEHTHARRPLLFRLCSHGGAARTRVSTANAGHADPGVHTKETRRAHVTESNGSAWFGRGS